MKGGLKPIEDLFFYFLGLVLWHLPGVDEQHKVELLGKLGEEVGCVLSQEGVVRGGAPTQFAGLLCIGLHHFRVTMADCRGETGGTRNFDIIPDCLLSSDPRYVTSV